MSAKAVGEFFTGLWGSYKLYIILALVGAAVGGGWYLTKKHHWIKEGENNVKIEVLKGQNKLMNKVRKANAKIDKETPFNSDKPAAINWLSGYTTAR